MWKNMHHTTSEILPMCLHIFVRMMILHEAAFNSWNMITWTLSPHPQKEKKNVSLAWHSWKNQDLLKRHKVYNTKETKAVGVYHPLSSDDSSCVSLGFASLLNCGVFGDLWQQSNHGDHNSVGRSSICHSVQTAQRNQTQGNTMLLVSYSLFIFSF